MKLNVSRQAISKWESNKAYPDIDNLILLRDIFNVTLDDLIISENNTKSEDIISPYSISKVKELMKNVSKEGTGKELNDLPGGCGVKTGTAQSTVNNIKVNHSWITGFYPENKPKYAITVLVEGNENGNKQALPIFKEICMKINNKIK